MKTVRVTFTYSSEFSVDMPLDDTLPEEQQREAVIKQSAIYIKRERLLHLEYDGVEIPL